ncbi:hypothetical protein HG535_0C03900 [Zygotorulaspora mrakii]|uniref:Uncharacterized protein n=1 Tax=Zygotorulaspora mrakii TaxID=42260 RepID=A0A7H9B0U7_ZYGMR|nr:uncharacterized protein HG535_0C03900 [Zygotorulaspora mrakii]QLG72036.1 hypothetical protein HG535_0C03900 [Zygotorulaspora mrakii]
MIHSTKKSGSSVKLDTLREEESDNTGEKSLRGEGSRIHSLPNHEKDFSGSQKGSSSNSSVSANSKMVGLGIARRPSHNLLLNSVTCDEPVGNHNIQLGLSQPKKNFAIKNDRPISNDSIATRTSELFSSNSSDANSGNSSLDNDNEGKKLRLNGSSTEFQTEEESDETENASSYDALSSAQGNTTNSISQSLTLSHKSDNKSVLSRNSTLKSSQSQQARYFFSNGNGPHSQVSFFDSTSNFSSPLKKVGSNENGLLNLKLQSKSQPSLPATSPLFNHLNSTSAIPTKTRLTPSQRYRLRKTQNETALIKSIRNKEKYYDEQDKTLEIQEADINDSVIWNIPMASHSTSSFLMSSNPKGLKKSDSTSSIPTENKRTVYNQSISSCSFLDTYSMPTSPIPGVNKTSDFQYMQQATKNISSVYLHSSHKLSKSKLDDRTASADFLPMEFKTASDLGFEDLVLVSEDKLDVTSHSRPSWLPPKLPDERKMHEEQISKSTSMASIEQLDRNKQNEERLLKDETNRQKFILLLDRGITRNSSSASLKKIIWQTAFSSELRYQMYSEILQSEVKLITEQYMEKFEDVMNVFDKMDFPRSKEAEIEQLIEIGIKRKIAGKENVSPDLILMLKLKAISQQGLLPGDELLFHHFLLDPSFESKAQVWETVNLIQMTCFNDICKEKYDSKILNSRGIVASYLLRGDDFKDEFNPLALNSSTWWNVLERIPHTLFMWILDIIVVSNSQCFKKNPLIKENFTGKSFEYYRSKHVVTNYKILLSFILNVLLNYHFGFNDLKSLSSLDDPNFCIPVPFDHLLDMGSINSFFIRKWLHYHKKF